MRQRARSAVVWHYHKKGLAIVICGFRVSIASAFRSGAGPTMEYVSDWYVTCGFRSLDRDMLRFYSA